MPSAAEEQAQAIADVERIGEELYRQVGVVGLLVSPSTWEALPDSTQDCYRRVARNMLKADVIRVGRRPNVERPMTGQQSLMSHDRREALDEAREHRERDER